jgi:hypothetical protein
MRFFKKAISLILLLCFALPVLSACQKKVKKKAKNLNNPIARRIQQNLGKQNKKK